LHIDLLAPFVLWLWFDCGVDLWCIFSFSNFRLTAPILIYSVGWSPFDFRSPALICVFVLLIAFSTICTSIYWDHLCFDCRVPCVPKFAGNWGPFVLRLIVPSLTVTICVFVICCMVPLNVS
jgi:hypothetical protein